MTEQPCLWEHLQRQGSFVALRKDWRSFFNCLSKVSKTYFSPMNLATSMKCGHRRCVEKCELQIYESGLEILGVCPQRMHSPIPLVRDDVMLYRLNPEVLHEHLAAALGLNPAHGKINGAQHSYCIGRSAPLRETPRFYYAIYATTVGKVKSAIKEIVAEDMGKKFVVLLPTVTFLTVEVKSLLAKANGEAQILSEVAPLQLDGTFTPSINVKEPKIEYHAAMRFPTPANCAWKDVTIAFQNDDEILVSALGVKQKYRFSELGMQNDKSMGHTVQWTLLTSFAEKDGEIQIAPLPKTIQKQKQILSKMLKEFMGLNDEPIPSVRGVYRCKFRIRPHTNFDHKASRPGMTPAKETYYSAFHDEDEQ